MTTFLAIADQFGNTVQVLGTARALFFLAMIVSEPLFRARRKADRATKSSGPSAEAKMQRRLSRFYGRQA